VGEQNIAWMFTSLLIAYINLDDLFLTQGIVIFMNSLNIKNAFVNEYTPRLIFVQADVYYR